MFHKPRSLRSGLLLLCGMTVLLSMFAFAVFAGWVINRRITDDAKQLLDRSITVAWQEYRRFFDEETRALQEAVGFEETVSAYLQQAERFTALTPAAEDDLRFAVDRQGRVFACSGGSPGSVPAVLLQRAAVSWQDGAAQSVSEALQLEEHPAFFTGALAEKAVLQTDPAEPQPDAAPVLLQMASVPVRDEDGTLLGCLAGVKICNNDEELGRRYSRLVSDSYISVSVDGLRILSNIARNDNKSFVGLKLPTRLFDTTRSGARYFGQTEPEPGNFHWVVGDPIRNGADEIIGTLAIGILFQQVAVVSIGALSVLAIALIVCLLCAFAMVSSLSKRISAPIIRLSRLTTEISQSKTITPARLEQLPPEDEAHISEIEQLGASFARMTASLYHRQEEGAALVRKLNEKQAALEKLAADLQQANSLLEERVRQRTEQLQQANDELQASNRLKTQFLANVSHEFRTPLNSIIGFSDVLTDELFGELNATQKEYLQIIRSSGNDLLALINDVLALSSMEQNGLTLSREPVRLDELIAASVAALGVQADAKQLTLQYTAAPLTLLADPLRLRQVLNNLLSNAIKFTPEGGKIFVRAAAEGSFAVVSVQDNGIGISKEDIKLVFKEFYQCGDVYRRRSDGVGLGLTLARQLVELHGGTIAINSAPGRGTTVTFTLPLTPWETSAGALPAPETPA